MHSSRVVWMPTVTAVLLMSVVSMCFDVLLLSCVCWGCAVAACCAQGLSAQHYHEELAAAEQLLRLVDPSRTADASDQLAAAQVDLERKCFAWEADKAGVHTITGLGAVPAVLGCCPCSAGVLSLQCWGAVPAGLGCCPCRAGVLSLQGWGAVPAGLLCCCTCG
jgi:hypothetical protein